MLPAAVTLAFVDDEMRGAAAWLNRRGYDYSLDREALRLAVELVHPRNDRPLRLVGDLNGYREVPPAWDFVDPKTLQPSKAHFPRGKPIEGGKASIFIDHRGKPTICAMFNRLAFADVNGPHVGWGPARGWLNLDAPNDVRATTIGEMLAVIDLHLLASDGCFA